MNLEPLRELDKVIELVAKATPGPWLYRAKSNTFHGPPPEGSAYSYGYSIMADDEDYPTLRDEDVDAILGAVNFIREHGAALLAGLNSSPVAWIASDNALQFNEDFMESFAWQPGVRFYTSPLSRALAQLDDGWRPIAELEEGIEALLYCEDYPPHFFVGSYTMKSRHEDVLVPEKGKRRTYEWTELKERDWGDAPSYGATHFRPLPSPPAQTQEPTT